MTRSPDGIIRLSIRDLVILFGAWSTLLVSWLTTSIAVRDLTVQVGEAKHVAQVFAEKEAAHEALPWHAGYGVTLPATLKEMQDIQDRLRAVESNNRRRLYGR